MTLADRLWEKVDRRGPDECWLWTAGTRRGYGQFHLGRRTTPAHRVAYELIVGPISTGLVLDHVCRNKLCVNPAHLDPVTQRENLLRGQGFPALNARKVRCVNGHEFTPENTAVERYPGGRRCIICRRATDQKRTPRHRGLSRTPQTARSDEPA